MNFINKMQENLRSGAYRGFAGLQFGDVTLSIQASQAHYCTPRKTLEDLTQYSRMEFALIREEEFISVRRILPDFPRLEEIEEFKDTVYAYVPVELIEELCEALVTKYN
ncbi:hypothetical protein [Ectobacillus ponti]|uniref:Uncharacterized protein n=1 Tax=Ectobacillus ponti TaxID=2961894 RepID=A0AA41XAF8_9BACI|nr:hypothetical protein [Ectobacillus ponti]MCP8969709.1 hypothetical protein [Ectobacillus ponti]